MHRKTNLPDSADPLKFWYVWKKLRVVPLTTDNQFFAKVLCYCVQRNIGVLVKFYLNIISYTDHRLHLINSLLSFN